MGNKPYSNLECIHCGLVIESPYPYSAGIRFKTLTEILDDKRNTEIKNRRWRKENERLEKF